MASTEQQRCALTYKLFIFQCINCYFSLLYIAFLKPYGISLFGVQMDNGTHRTFTYHADPGVQVGERVRLQDGGLAPA